MHARHHDVELRKQVRLLIERAVVEDVDLDAGQDAKRRELLVELAKQRGELVRKDLNRFAETTVLDEGRICEVFG